MPRRLARLVRHFGIDGLCDSRTCWTSQLSSRPAHPQILAIWIAFGTRTSMTQKTPLASLIVIHTLALRLRLSATRLLEAPTRHSDLEHAVSWSTVRAQHISTGRLPRLSQVYRNHCRSYGDGGYLPVHRLLPVRVPSHRLQRLQDRANRISHD
jgi:hypothetical protein